MGGSLGWKHPRAKSIREEDLEKGEEDRKRRRASIQIYFISSPIFLPLLIYYGCISPLHNLISFSRVFDVV